MVPSDPVAPGGVDTATGFDGVRRRGRTPLPITDRPLPVLDLVDGALSAVRQRPRVLLSVALIFAIPAALVNGWLARDTLGGAGLVDVMDDPTLVSGTSPGSASGDALAGYLLSWLSTAVTGVGVSRVVGGWLVGRDDGLADVCRFLLRRWWVIGVAFVLIHVLEAIGFVLLVLPGLWLVVLFSLTSPVMALEDDLGPVAAMRRSAELVRRRFGPCVGVIALTGLVGSLLGWATSALPEFVALFIGTGRAWPLVTVSQVLATGLVLPFTGAAMCLLYLDLRFRTEGLDLELRLIDSESPLVEVGAPGSPLP